uniref:Ubiquitin-like domain-containing protein n=1 Tax=Equus asinus TaxID=9793 RepID=A0A8C4MYE4_EQUAS
MEVFVMICHHKITISGDTKESSPMPELKRLVEGILEWPPAQQRLYENDQLPDDIKCTHSRSAARG